MVNKPNILFIMCDQMRHDAVACNGNEIVQTPNLDRLAASGVNFSNSYTPDPICVPARASLTSGHYPHKCTGTKENTGCIKEGMPLLGEELNKRGYETYAMGKLHYLPYTPPGEPNTSYGIKNVELCESGRMIKKFDFEGKTRGIEEYDDYLYKVGWGGYTRGHGLGNNEVMAAPSPIPEEHYVDKWVVDRSIHHLKEHIEEQGDKPFFMFTSFPKPHSAYDPPRPYDQLYDPRDIPFPIGEAEERQAIEIIKKRGLDLLFSDYKKYMWDLLSPQAKKVIRAHYYGLVTFQDKQIGRLMDFLEEKELTENTIVVYTADHGDLLGDFGLYFKRTFYNGSVKVPLMISYPDKIKAGQVSDELVGLQDLLPTLMSLTGESLEHEVDGKDLTPLLEDDKPVREYYVSQCQDNPHQRYMVASKEWKYIYYQYGGIEELYNLQEDPDELNNLAGEDSKEIQQTKKKLREYLISWCLENGDTQMIDENSELVKSERKSEEEILASSHTREGKRSYSFGRRWY